MNPEQPEVYRLLRHLTTPVTAITTSAGGRRNGLIVNSAQRASLVPEFARISVYISKTNFSHDVLYASGVFGVHLLRNDQWDVIRALGLRSARDVPDKLADLATRTGVTGCPMLSDVVAGFECRVVNAMDAGAATFFLGDIVDVQKGTPGDVLTSPYFRSNAPSDLLAEYESLLRVAQGELTPLAGKSVWYGNVDGGDGGALVGVRIASGRCRGPFLLTQSRRNAETQLSFVAASDDGLQHTSGSAGLPDHLV